MIKIIVIVGAGAAGLACAISASSAKNTNIFLLEKTAHLGGTVTHSLIHTIGGLYNADGEYLNQGLSLELAKRLLQASSHTTKRKIGKSWVLNVDPVIYENVVTSWIKSQSNIKLFHDTQVTQVEVVDSLINQIEWTTRNGIKTTIQPTALVDATGSAAVVRMINPRWVLEGEALAGLICQIRGVVEAKALQFPKNINFLRAIQKAVDDGKLPTEYAMAWLDTGFMKMKYILS